MTLKRFRLIITINIRKESKELRWILPEQFVDFFWKAYQKNKFGGGGIEKQLFSTKNYCSVIEVIIIIIIIIISENELVFMYVSDVKSPSFEMQSKLKITTRSSKMYSCVCLVLLQVYVNWD